MYALLRLLASRQCPALPARGQATAAASATLQAQGMSRRVAHLHQIPPTPKLVWGSTRRGIPLSRNGLLWRHDPALPAGTVLGQVQGLKRWAAH